MFNGRYGWQSYAAMLTISFPPTFLSLPTLSSFFTSLDCKKVSEQKAKDLEFYIRSAVMQNFH